MNRTVAIVAAVAAVLVGAGAIWWFSQGTEQPTIGATAPPVTTTVATETTAATDDEPAEPGGPVTYALTESARAVFTLDEELRGNPTTVVGTSRVVLGEILVDPSDPSTLQIGTILVNARAFETDAGSRNRAIRGPILDADTFENIEFTPTSIDGLPSEPAETLSFSVVGDLTIRDTTNAVTFDVTLSTADQNRITGSATATVDRTEWGLNIPSAPGVANVSETVMLALQIDAAPTS